MLWVASVDSFAPSEPTSQGAEVPHPLVSLCVSLTDFIVGSGLVFRPGPGAKAPSLVFLLLPLPAGFFAINLPGNCAKRAN